LSPILLAREHSCSEGKKTPSPQGTTCYGIGSPSLDYSVKLSRSRAIGRK
jgi:hypothetical protein